MEPITFFVTAMIVIGAFLGISYYIQAKRWKKIKAESDRRFDELRAKFKEESHRRLRESEAARSAARKQRSYAPASTTTVRSVPTSQSSTDNDMLTAVILNHMLTTTNDTVRGTVTWNDDAQTVTIERPTEREPERETTTYTSSYSKSDDDSSTRSSYTSSYSSSYSSDSSDSSYSSSSSDSSSSSWD